MAQFTRTLEFQTEDNNDTGTAGWVVSEMPGFDPISVETGKYNTKKYWSQVLTHDIIEHDPSIAVGTVANEWGAFGAMWSGRVEDDSLIDHNTFENDVAGLLETLNGYFYSFDSNSDYDDLIDELDNHIGLPDGDYVIDDYMREIITPWFNSHSCDYFTAGDRFCTTLIERCLGWMQIGADTFTARYAGADYGGIFERIQWQIGEIFGSPDDVLEAVGFEAYQNGDMTAPDEFWDDFTVILTIDTNSLEVTATVDNHTRVALEEYVIYDSENEDEDEDEDEDE